MSAASLPKKKNYGSKAENLLNLLQNIAKWNAKGLHFKIPPIHPLASEDLLDIFAKCGLDISKEWQQAIAQIQPPQPGADINLWIAANAHVLQPLQQRIIDISSTVKFIKLVKALQFEDKTLNKFLNADVMVRSSSNEDSPKAANAGGNQSFPATKDINDVAQKISMVIASYFSANSLAQRAQSKQNISELPLCSVLLQKIISEEDQEEPTVVSGVTFTSKPDGETDLMLINCTWGHGEGVVKGAAPTDGYYVTPQNKVYRVIIQKTTRIFPKDMHALISRLTPKKWANRACLTSAQIQELANICRAIEVAYGGPQDIEWVFKNGTFFIVQRRPLVARPAQELNYIRPTDKQLALATAQSVVPAMNVRVIDSPSQVLIVDTMHQALEYFLEKHPADIRAVFVKEGVATSHEAVEFRQKGIPVFAVANNLSLIQEQVKQQQPLVICSQTGKIYVGKTADFTIAKGSYAHPFMQGGMSLSFLLPIQRQIHVQPESVKTAHQPYSPFATINKLIDRLRLNDDPKIAFAIDNEIKIIYDFARKNLLDKSGRSYDRELIIELDILRQNALEECIALRDIANTTRTAQNKDQLQLQKLLAINRLENIIKQDPSQQIINAFSLRRLMNEIAWVKKVLAMPEFDFANMDYKIRELLIQCFRYSKLCISSSQAARLRKFLYDLAKEDPDNFLKLHGILADYAKNGAITVVINTMDLSKADTSSKTRLSIVNKQLAAHTAFAQSNATSVLAAAKILDAEWLDKEKTQNIWGKENNYLANRQDFQRFIDSFATRIDLLYAAKKAQDTIQQQMLINSLTASLYVYDSALKAISGAPNYGSPNVQAKHFASLLQPYCAMSLQLVETSLEDLNSSYTYKEGWENSANSMFKNVKNINDAASYMVPNPQFDVSQNLYTRGTDFIPFPQDLPGNFTLAHQNALLALGQLNTKCFNIFDYLPDKIKSIIPNETKLINYHLEGQFLTLHLNRSLRDHSVSFTIKYDINNPENAEVVATFIMSNENNRCISTRLMARQFVEEGKQQYPSIKLLGFSPVMSAEYGYFYSNRFRWNINLHDLTINESVAFKEHIEALCEATFGVGIRGLSYQYYESMFHDSYAGMENILKILISKGNAEILVTAIAEILTELPKKIIAGQTGELSIFTSSINDSFYQAIVDLLASNNKKIRERIYGVILSLLDDPQNFAAISAFGSGVKFYDYLFYNLYIKLSAIYKNLPDKETNDVQRKLCDAIRDKIRQFVPYDPSTPVYVSVMQAVLFPDIAREQLPKRLTLAFAHDLDNLVIAAEWYYRDRKILSNAGNSITGSACLQRLQQHPNETANIARFIIYMLPLRNEVIANAFTHSHPLDLTAIAEQLSTPEIVLNLNTSIWKFLANFLTTEKIELLLDKAYAEAIKVDNSLTFMHRATYFLRFNLMCTDKGPCKLLGDIFFVWLQKNPDKVGELAQRIVKLYLESANGEEPLMHDFLKTLAPTAQSPAIIKDLFALINAELPPPAETPSPR